MKIFSYIYPRRVIHQSSSYNKAIDVAFFRNKHILRVNGIEQSGPYTEKLWRNGLRSLPKAEKEVKNILIFGVGGGTVYHMLADKFPEAHMIGVDIDIAILRLAREYFGLDELDNIKLIEEDAARYVRTAKRQKKQFDLIIVDIYTGNDVPEFVSGDEFLGALKLITAPGGTVLMNYFSFANQRKNAEMLLDKLTKIYHSVVSRKNLHNVFFYSS